MFVIPKEVRPTLWSITDKEKPVGTVKAPGRASYRAATGYVTTAKYIGDIVAEGIESVTYTVIYTGTPSSILQRVAAKSAEDFPVILISLVVIVLAITAAVLIWRCHKRRQEDTVYHEDFSEEEDEHEE